MRRREYPDLSRWPHVIQGSLKVEKGCRRVSVRMRAWERLYCWLCRWKGVWAKGYRQLLGGERGRKTDFLLEPPEKNKVSYDTSILAQWGPCQTSDLQKCTIINLLFSATKCVETCSSTNRKLIPKLIKSYGNPYNGIHAAFTGEWENSLS